MGEMKRESNKAVAIKQQWNQDGTLGIIIQDPPESGTRTHLLYFTYLYGILSRVQNLVTSLLVLLHYKNLFFLQIASDVVNVLLIC